MLIVRVYIAVNWSILECYLDHNIDHSFVPQMRWVGEGLGDGAGINEKDLQVIIDPWSRRLHKLCITKHIARSHRGDIVCSRGFECDDRVK